MLRDTQHAAGALSRELSSGLEAWGLSPDEVTFSRDRKDE